MLYNVKVTGVTRESTTSDMLEELDGEGNGSSTNVDEEDVVAIVEEFLADELPTATLTITASTD